MLPEFLIIGGQRCGTTSLYNYLTQHPDVRSALRKEVHYFDVRATAPARWYRAHFPMQPRRGSRPFTSGEGTPYYLFHPAAPDRIQRLLPRVKLIALLRNPVDRAYSHYQREVRRRRETVSLSEALKLEPQRLAGEAEKLRAEPSYHSPAHQHQSYLARGIYVDQLQSWHRVFPREQLLIVSSEEFFASPADVFTRVLEFLELPRMTLRQFDRFQSATYSEMPSAERTWLQNYFKPHNERLYNYLGRDFQWER
jgi:hypothetical protein